MFDIFDIGISKLKKSIQLTREMTQNIARFDT